MSDLQIFVLVVAFFVYQLVCYQAGRKQKLLLSVLIDDVINDKDATEKDLNRAMDAYRLFDKSWFWLICAVMVPFAAPKNGQYNDIKSLSMMRFEREAYKLAMLANPLSVMVFTISIMTWWLIASLWKILLVTLALSSAPSYANPDITSANRVSTQYVIGRLNAHHQR